MSLTDVFKNANQCTSVTFTPFSGEKYTVQYSFGSFVTSAGEKAYTRSVAQGEDVIPSTHVAMADVGKVRVTVWSGSEANLKSDLEKAMKAANQKP